MNAKLSIAEQDERQCWMRARERVGTTFDQRLDWVLGFINRDLSRSTAAERVIDGYCLKALVDVPPLPNRPENERVRLPTMAARWRGPLADAAIKRLHRELRAGIHAVLAPPLPVARRFASDAKLGWSLPPQSTYLVRLGVSPDAYRPRRAYRFMRAVAAHDDRGAIIDAVVRLIELSGNALRSCDECGKPFRGVKRQDYCSGACSQKARNRRRPKGDAQ